MSDRCPYCKSALVSGTPDGTLDGTNPITWECGSLINTNIIIPAEECKKRLEKLLEIKPTPVNDYITALKKLDPLLPERVIVKEEKPTDEFTSVIKSKLGIL